MNRHDEALQVLFILRRRLLDRMAGIIVDSRESLLNGSSHTSNPLSAHRELADIIRSLGELDHAIAGLAEAVDRNDVADPATITHTTEANVAQSNGHSHMFDRYLHLIASNRLEEASRELSRVLHMPLDRVNTATRYLARAMKADAKVTATVADLAERLPEMDESEAMRSMMRVFGFQAVEARMAVQALQSGVAGTLGY